MGAGISGLGSAIGEVFELHMTAIKEVQKTAIEAIRLSTKLGTALSAAMDEIKRVNREVNDLRERVRELESQ